jgi:hypothetical protein
VLQRPRHGERPGIQLLGVVAGPDQVAVDDRGQRAEALRDGEEDRDGLRPHLQTSLTVR